MFGVTLVNELALGVIFGYIGYKVGSKKEQIKNIVKEKINKKD